jgi:hypothetical protein
VAEGRAPEAFTLQQSVEELHWLDPHVACREELAGVLQNLLLADEWHLRAGAIGGENGSDIEHDGVRPRFLESMQG